MNRNRGVVDATEPRRGDLRRSGEETAAPPRRRLRSWVHDHRSEMMTRVVLGACSSLGAGAVGLFYWIIERR